MIVSSALLRDLRGQLKLLEQDLRRQAEDSDVAWSGDLRSEYDAAFDAAAAPGGYSIPLRAPLVWIR